MVMKFYICQRKAETSASMRQASGVLQTINLVGVFFCYNILANRLLVTKNTASEQEELL